MNAKLAKAIRRAAQVRHEPTEYVTEGVTTRTFEQQTSAGIELHACQIIKPIYVKNGSTRRVYKTLKRLQKTVGLNKVLTELEKAVSLG